MNGRCRIDRQQSRCGVARSNIWGIVIANHSNSASKINKCPEIIDYTS
jgi:hypothetical protein